jgi:hypothetical protein
MNGQFSLRSGSFQSKFSPWPQPLFSLLTVNQRPVDTVPCVYELRLRQRDSIRFGTGGRIAAEEEQLSLAVAIAVAIAVAMTVGGILFQCYVVSMLQISFCEGEGHLRMS